MAAIPYNTDCCKAGQKCPVRLVPFFLAGKLRTNSFRDNHNSAHPSAEPRLPLVGPQPLLLLFQRPCLEHLIHLRQVCRHGGDGHHHRIRRLPHAAPQVHLHLADLRLPAARPFLPHVPRVYIHLVMCLTHTTQRGLHCVSLGLRLPVSGSHRTISRSRIRMLQLHGHPLAGVKYKTRRYPPHMPLACGHLVDGLQRTARLSHRRIRQVCRRQRGRSRPTV